LTFLRQFIFAYEFVSLYRHAPVQSPPFVVTIIPDNDSGQQVTLSTDTIHLLETDLTTPAFLFSNLTISDADNTPCNPQLLQAAQVKIVDETNSPTEDILQASLIN